MGMLIAVVFGSAFPVTFLAVGWWERRQGRVRTPMADYFGIDGRA
jgi:hypothetical protein